MAAAARNADIAAACSAGVPAVRRRRFNDPSGQVSNDWHLVSRTQSGRTMREYWKNSETGQTNTITRSDTVMAYRSDDETYTPGRGTELTVLTSYLSTYADEAAHGTS